jgi:hypothetical protein
VCEDRSPSTRNRQNIRSEVLTVVTMTMRLTMDLWLWVATPCSSKIVQHFIGTFHFHILCQKVNEARNQKKQVSCWFTLQSWKGTKYVAPKHQEMFQLQGFTTQNNILLRRISGLRTTKQDSQRQYEFYDVLLGGWSGHNLE